jgi:hypothetical protein
MEGDTLFEKEGRPDISKSYDRNFLQLGEQTANVLEKLKVHSGRMTGGPNNIYFTVIIKLNLVDKYNIYIEIEKINKSRSVIHLDFRIREEYKISFWRKKLEKFKDDFFELLDSETLEANKFKEIYAQNMDEFSRAEFKDRAQDIINKWDSAGTFEHAFMRIMIILTIVIFVIFGLTYLGLIFDVGTLRFLAIGIMVFTMFTFLVMWEYWNYKEGKMRLIKLDIPRQKIKVVGVIEEVLAFLKIQYMTKKKSLDPFKVIFENKEQKFRIRIYFHHPEILSILIQPVTAENKPVTSRIMTRLDERFIEEDYSFYTMVKGSGRKKNTVESGGEIHQNP